jgi:sodium-independent sulfate anion transporter 11
VSKKTDRISMSASGSRGDGSARGSEEVGGDGKGVAAAAAAAGSSTTPALNAGRTVAVHGINRPLFHVDLTSALQSAIANVEARGEIPSSGEGESSDTSATLP